MEAEDGYKISGIDCSGLKFGSIYAVNHDDIELTGKEEAKFLDAKVIKEMKSTIFPNMMSQIVFKSLARHNFMSFNKLVHEVINQENISSQKMSS